MAIPFCLLAFFSRRPPSYCRPGDVLQCGDRCACFRCGAQNPGWKGELLCVRVCANSVRGVSCVLSRAVSVMGQVCARRHGRCPRMVNSGNGVSNPGIVEEGARRETSEVR